MLSDIEIFETLSAIIITIGAISFYFAYRKRRELFLWTIVFGLMANGYIFKMLFPHSFKIVANISFILASFVALVSSWLDFHVYVKKDKKFPRRSGIDPYDNVLTKKSSSSSYQTVHLTTNPHGNKKILPVFFITFLESIIQLRLEWILLIATIITAYFELSVFIHSQKRVYLFLGINFVVYTFTAVCYTLEIFGIEWVIPLESGFSIISATIIGIAGTISMLETKVEAIQKEYLKTLERQNKELHEKTKRAEQIATIVKSLSEIAEQVSASSENIAATQQDISQGANKQAIAISTIQHDIEILSEITHQILHKTEGISELTNQIKNIAHQTNILALNASIEAARAGSYGLGFSVVASQVQELANETQQPLSTSEKLLQEISQITKAEKEKALKILEQINEISAVAEEISASTEESAAAAEQQSATIQSISDITEQLLDISQNLIKYN